jgi:hypothetical protein
VSRVVDIYEISAIVAAIGVLVGVIYYVLDLRHQTKMRHTDLVMRLYSDWGSEELQKAVGTVMRLEFKDYDDYVKKYGSSLTTDAFAGIWKVAWFFNGVGVLVQGKLADVELVDKLFGYMILGIWEGLKPIIEGMKKQLSPHAREQRALEWFEYLYNEMKKREQQLQQRGA